MATIGPLSPRTSTGIVLVTVEPSPSCPNALLPQHRTVPADVRAHVWPSLPVPPLAVIAVTAGAGWMARRLFARASRVGVAAATFDATSEPASATVERTVTKRRMPPSLGALRAIATDAPRLRLALPIQTSLYASRE